MSAALTKEQKRYLAQLANQAFARQRALALGRGEEWPHRADEWRHNQVASAVGRLGLRCCSQDDYGSIKGHFLDLLGAHGAALRADFAGRPEANRKRVVTWKIQQELERLRKEMAYAEGICRRMHRGLGLGDVGERELWKVFYALRYQK